jgi:transcriptional repressor NrdR
VRCPYCSTEDNRVIDSRLGRDGEEIRRRRECLECERRFTTRERVEYVLPKIIKRDERREEFSREKLTASLQKACAKRAVSVDAIGRIADRVERRLQDTGESEITSRQVGDRVMEELVALDPMAAVRFASVYQRFDGPEDYQAFFAKLAVLRRRAPADDPDAA